MKYLPVLIICFFYHVSFSQVEFVTIQDSAFVTIKAKLDFQRNHAFVESISNPKELIEFPRIRLENGDVIIEYELNNKSRGIFEVQLMTINTLRGKYPEKPELYYGNVGNGISKGSGLNKSFTIINTSKNDNIKWLDGSVTFKIRVINHRTVIIKTRGLGQKLLDCSDVMPTLQFPESFIPELIFGGIGAITYGIGEWIDEESDDLYVQYTDQEEKEAADGIYEDANRKHQEAFIIKGSRDCLV